MLVTVWCVGLTLFGLVLVGMPVQWLLGGRRPLNERDWIHVPFLGMGIVILVPQNLVYCNLPIVRTAWVVWGAAGLLWVWLAARRQLRPCLASFPRSVCGVVLLVYLVQGAGLLVLGAREYVGRAWSDQFNYTSMAELYTYFPFKTTLAATADRPWLVWPLLYKHDRIGQSILHGFLAHTGGVSTKMLFEPVILLCPALSALALFALARRFGLGRVVLVTAAAAGLMPGLALLHLESFLSHALSVPLLLFLPLALDDVNERPTLGVLIRTAVLIATLVAVYSELTPLLAGVLVLSLLVMIAARPVPWRLLGGYALLAASPALLNWYFFRYGLYVLLMRVAVPVLQDLYPWALTLEGWGRLWLGDLAATPPGTDGTVVRLFTAGVTGLAFLGLLKRWQGCFAAARAGWSEPDRRRQLALASCVLALAAAPVLVGIKDDHHAYQFYKLLLTLSPLWILGLAVLPDLVPAGTWRWNWPRLAAALPLGAVLVLAGLATGRMALESADRKPHPRSSAHLLVGEDMRKLQDLLEGCAGGDVLVGNANPMRTTWLGYYARKNRVWLYSTVFVDVNVIYVAEVRPRLDLCELPADLRVVTEHGKLFTRVSPGDVALEWSGQSFQLWHARSRNWALPLAMRIPFGLEQLEGQPFFWVGGPPVELEVVAARPGVITLSARILAGPSLQGTTTRNLRVRSAPERKQDYREYDPLLARQGLWVRNAVERVKDWRLEHGPAVLTVPVPAGHSFIRLEALDKPNVAVQSNGDPRAMLIGVQGLEVSFTPAVPLDDGEPGALATGVCPQAAHSGR